MYAAQAKNGILVFMQPQLISDLLRENEGLFLRVTINAIRSQQRNPKTSKQLGYYRALLLPEIHQQLVRDGHTVEIEVAGIHREIPITEKAVHELLIQLCGHVGNDGEILRTSQMNKPEMSKFVDNVLDFAGELRMNTAALNSWRPIDDESVSCDYL
jgi:hypothetical protein